MSPDLLPALRPLIAATRSPLSEYSLANLLLFRERHAYRFHETPIPHVRGITYDGEHHALPLAPLDAAACALLLGEADCIGPLGDEAPGLADAFGLRCDWRDADSDYVYDTDRMAVLAGAKAKRAQARAFEREQRPQARRLDASTVTLAEAVLEGWRGDVGRSDDDTDCHECREALRLRDVLGLEGLVVTISGDPVAFLLSGPAADGSRIVHFAKGRRAFSAAYPWMFARHAAAIGRGRINFEQDLGRPGFAQAKRAFAPVARLRKYRLRAK
ncbi:phosphatidylglycerol lysyltransferase domain-containing protein [Sphingosinicella sp. LHD-64]|uniref:phosphatidylglycerol lysyltransferase domain-containing protein n=1 Tax=Sphingosinicella sp. LHD-64 TaxID=3072139 RepID=UPI00281096C4|nr:phosphatidylglycerol lysyltransferase domain-containing protein [Sphingosinicella sp. LHD-64]MDQ8757606.1 phosphatidylglycerol lysyltransferase domain-containing protein [Sphingosinicella sp. LHD-64]